jgi:arylsulfatase A-like enzyme
VKTDDELLAHAAGVSRWEAYLMGGGKNMGTVRMWMRLIGALLLASSLVAMGPAGAQAQAKKPNILILWGDDIGWFNVSAYNHGTMGYRTPNIDRLAKDGAMFTDWYGQQSCTAGRSAFITGQTPFRTGLLKVGLPGAKEGLQKEDVTLGELLKAQGYMTGQFGKNHLGDRDEHLPTAHGFDEFFGSLYHLNAEDEPEHPDYFKDPELRKRFGTRGVIHTWVNPDGTQKIESTGPLTKKRMETVDEEFTKGALDFMERAKKADKPFFIWWNSTRMHIWTRLKKESEGTTGLGIYPDGMVEHDGHVGQLLDKLKELGLEDNTIVMYSTDNGAEVFTWPDGGATPFRGEKNTNWEGGFRVPCVIRWPGVIKPGTVLNDIAAHEDMIPTLMAAVGEPDIKEKLKKGLKVGAKTFKVHLDGYNQMDYFAGKAPSARKEFFYFNDDGSLVALRYDKWKLVFAEQRAHGLEVWQDPFVTLRFPKLFNLRSDPFETADHESMDYGRWRAEHLFMLVPAQQYVGQFLATFKEFPPRQKTGSFGIDQALESLTRGAGDK